MKHICLITLLALIANPTLACMDDHAHPNSAGVTIDSVRLVATTDATRPTAMYFTLKNINDTDRVLTAVTTPACGHTELHDHIKDGDVMRMRAVPRVTIKPSETVTFAPLALHVMCFDPQLPMNVGSKVPVTLTFTNADDTETQMIKLSASIVSMKDAAKTTTQTPPTAAPSSSPTHAGHDHHH